MFSIILSPNPLARSLLARASILVKDASTIMVRRWHPYRYRPPNNSSIHISTKVYPQQVFCRVCPTNTRSPRPDVRVNLLAPAKSPIHQLLESVSTHAKTTSLSHPKIFKFQDVIKIKNKTIILIILKFSQHLFSSQGI